MAVRVVTTVQTNLPGAVTHREATRFEHDVEGGLSLFGADPRRPVAGYSPGAWASVEVLPEPEPVNAAEPADSRKLADDLLANSLSAPLNFAAYEAQRNRLLAALDSTTTAQAVLSETTEPYVCVSVTGNDADEVGRLIRDFLRRRDAKVVVDNSPEAHETFVKSLRKVIRTHGARSFGLKPDDGLGGVRKLARS